jgi:hypothetical protein
VLKKIPDMPAGFGASFGYNFSKYLGLELDFGHNWDNYETTVSAGPRLMFRGEDAAFFIHAMASYNRLSITGLSTTNGIGAVMGGGMDIKLTRLVSWRAFEADYVGAAQRNSAALAASDFRPELKGVRLRTGLVFNLGYPETNVPTATISIQPSEVMVANR